MVQEASVERSGAGNAPNATPRWVHTLARVTVAGTFLLICFGGLVKSLGAGLSVPDWPLSYGQPKSSVVLSLAGLSAVLAVLWMVRRTRFWAGAAILAGAGLAGTYYFFGPVPGWYHIRNIRAEHGHRLIAGTVGFLTAILAAALWQTDARRWVRRLGVAALFAVAAQALLGGLTVRYLLPPWVSASHASLAQAFFGLVVILAVVSSPRWFESRPPLPQAPQDGTPPSPPLPRLCIWMLAAIYFQILFGAAVRHTPHKLEGGVNALFWWHLGAHLCGFLFVGFTLARALFHLLQRFRKEPYLARPAKILMGLFFLQVLLGIGVLFLRLTMSAEDLPEQFAPHPLKDVLATAHVAGGALIWGVAWVVTLRVYRRVAAPPAARRAPALASPGAAP